MSNLLKMEYRCEGFQYISNLELKIISSMIMTSTKWGRGDHCKT